MEYRSRTPLGITRGNPARRVQPDVENEQGSSALRRERGVAAEIRGGTRRGVGVLRPPDEARFPLRLAAEPSGMGELLAASRTGHDPAASPRLADQRWFASIDGADFSAPTTSIKSGGVPAAPMNEL